MSLELGTFDVAVLGGGNAGLCAALTARQAGARVIVLECAPRDLRGGNSRHTRNLRCAHAAPTDVLTEAYPEDELMSDLLRVNANETDEGWHVWSSSAPRRAPPGCGRSASASRRRCAGPCTCRARTPSSSAAARR